MVRRAACRYKVEIMRVTEKLVAASLLALLAGCSSNPSKIQNQPARWWS
jgi:starvation-inducible outer membrane lipoprotein